MDIEQFLNDIRENCLISSLNDNECMWNAIQSKAYQTNISYQEFSTYVLPFLVGTGLYYEDLINANVDVKGCLASGDFGGCAGELYLEEKFDVDIITVFIINGILMGKDNNGILHVDIDSLSMENSSEVEILDQLLNVIQATRLLFCETEIYEPIDLRDYFHDLRIQNWTATWNTHNGVALEMPFQFNQYVIETSPSYVNYPDGRIGYNYFWSDTTLPGILISVPLTAGPDIEEYLFAECN